MLLTGPSISGAGNLNDTQLFRREIFEHLASLSKIFSSIAFVQNLHLT